MKTLLSRFEFVSAVMLVAASSVPVVHAATWDGNAGVGDLNWSTSANWNPDGSQVNQAVVFDNTAGGTASATTVGNIVNSSLTIDSLSYANTGTTGSTWRVTQIASGQTLTLDAVSTPPATIFSVGGVSSLSTRVAITGPGTLTVNEATSSIAVGTPTANQSAVLDMSGLSVFNATVASVNFGASRGNGDVTLANTNTITTTTFNLGNVTASTGGSSKSDLLLGSSNTINADTINVGLNFASGTIGFRAGLTTPTVTIRGSSGGTSRADLTIANTLTTGVTNAQGSSVDFTASGGSVDAMIGTLLVGRRGDAGSTTTYAGSLTMNKGTIDATTVILGQSAGTGASANTVTGDLNVSGGAFTAGVLTMADNSAGATSVVSNLNISGTGMVTVAGNIIAGAKSGTATSVAANVTVNGGTLTVGGNLGEGAGGASVTSTVILSAGTLDMTHGNIAVDTFTFTSGTLKNVASFNAGTTGGLNVQNASTLAYGVDGSFTPLTLTGDLTLGASSNLQLTLATGFVPEGNFLLVDNNLLDSIIGTFATINGGAFGLGNSFTLSNNTGSYAFTLDYAGGSGNDLVAVFSTIPEPSTYAFLAGTSILALAAWRRRRS